MEDPDLDASEPANAVRLDVNDVSAPAASVFAPKPAPPVAASVSPPTPPDPVYGVLLDHAAGCWAGQVVFGTAAQMEALGASVRPSTPEEISFSAPAHFPLEA